MVKTGLQRRYQRVLNGIKNGTSLDSTIWNGVEWLLFAVPHLFSLLFVVPPFFDPFLTSFVKKGEKRSLENRGTGKERKAFFLVSFPFPFFTFLSRHISRAPHYRDNTKKVLYDESCDKDCLVIMICGWWYIWGIEHMAQTCQCLLLLYSLVVVCTLRSHCVVSPIQCICEVSASSRLSSPLRSLGDRLTCCRVAYKHCTTCTSNTRHEFSAIDSQFCGSQPQLISNPVQ